MRMTLGVWLGGASLFGLGVFAGKYAGGMRGGGLQSEATLLQINEDAGLIKSGERTIRVRDLQPSARFALGRLLEQFVVQAQRSAEGQAALVEIQEKKGTDGGWRGVFSREISKESLKKVYDENQNFRQSGAFADVWPDVERFVLERERNKLIGAFLEEKYSKQQLDYVQHDAIFPEFPFDASGYPRIWFGDQFKDETPEVLAFFRYGGRLSNGFFRLIEEISREQSRKIPVRLIPEISGTAYDDFAVGALFRAQKMAGEKPELFREIHKLLLSEPLSPDAARLASEADLIPVLREKLRAKGMQNEGNPNVPQNLSSITIWMRDFRNNRQPQVFVANRFVSETSPRGFPDALRASLGLKSVVGR
ncbi:MAG: hypothetical protein EBR09_03685 [Proteobacteria bacterium]|nr:hypothetical protein [Pseudomonadota bacterium]